MAEVAARRSRKGWYLLFLVQFIAVLWVPFYNTAQPAIMGVPMFYWYQLLCVLVGAALNFIVYKMTR